jgi:tRNA threonylcarbamoyladenosine biosynthesis protein TsaB
MHYLLHIDTSGDTGTIAMSCDGRLLAREQNENSRDHAASINMIIDRLTKQCGITLADLSGIVVCAGPGSYTGLRIGLATAKGICYALNKPLLLDNKLTLLAYQNHLQHQQAYDQYIVLLTARQKEYFIAVYDNSFTTVLAPKHIMEEELDTLIEKKDNTLLLTDLGPEMVKLFNTNKIHLNNDTQLNLEAWAGYAYQQFNCNGFVNLSNAEPFYLKQVYTHK